MFPDRRNFCLAAVLGAARRNENSSTAEKDIDAAVRAALRAWKVPGAAVAVVRDDRVEYLQGHGLCETGETKRVTPDTLFPLASCSKGFLTASLAMLADEGKLRWDDPVRKHLPTFRLSDPLADARVTLRDLLCHRTGLGQHDLLWYRAAWPPEEAVRRAGRLPLSHSFRSRFQYQNTMFTALGLALSETAGRPWHEFLEKRLFGPLGMKTAGYSTAAFRGDRATGHRLNGREEPEGANDWVPFPRPDAALSLHASARDLCGWLRFQLDEGKLDNDRLVSAVNLRQTYTPQMVVPHDLPEQNLHPETHQVSYGMGWVIQEYRGLKMVAHSGVLDGFRVQLTLVPAKRLGLAVLSNLHATRMNLALSYTLLDLLLRLERRDWNAWMIREVNKGRLAAARREAERFAKRHHDTKPSRILPAYAGTFEHPAYGTARVAAERRGLVLRYSSFEGVLEHFHYDTFLLRHPHLGDVLFTFALDAAGDVVEMTAVDWFGVVFRRKAG